MRSYTPSDNRFCCLFVNPWRWLYSSVLFQLVFFLILCVNTLNAQDFEDLRQRYLRLRNTDSKVTEPLKWIVLAKEFEAFSKSKADPDQIAWALFNTSQLYRTLAERSPDKDYRERHTEALVRLIKRYPKHERAPEAFVELAEEALLRDADLDRARALYLRVLRDYPSSEHKSRAELRLKQIIDGSYKKEQQQAIKFAERDESRPLIVLDPGHGGEDFGAKGVGGLLEKDVTLDVALRLEKLLSQWSDVALTRRVDKFMPLQDRTERANQLDADLFISLHTNASPSHLLSGLEVFYLDNTNDAASRRLAERENGVTENGSVSDVSLMVSDLIQNAKLVESIELAHHIEGNILKRLKFDWPDTKSLGVKSGPFYVLVGAHMPCILAEMLFIDHPKDGQLLAERHFRQGLSEGIESGIKQFLKR